MKAPTSDEPIAALCQRLAATDPLALAQLLRELPERYEAMAMQAIEAEVTQLCGKRGTVNKNGYQRWGTNPGSIVYGTGRIQISVPRVRDTNTGKEVPLKTYQLLHQRDPKQIEKLTALLLSGVSQRDYKDVAGEFTDCVGLSQSSVARMFETTTTQALEEFESSRLDQEKYVALLIDGKCLKGVQMILALGVTRTGKKQVLGYIESTTENSDKATALLENLVHRGFSYAGGILVIIDGSKGLRKAVQHVFGDQAVIQRCQWHKRENVVQHTKQKGEAERAKGRLQDAYDQPDYERTRKALVAIHDDLQPGQPRAAASLREGLHETLTVLRLPLHETLRRSFKTSNLIENLNSVISHRTRNVKRWRSTNQRHRWFAAIFKHYESRLSRILEPVHLRAMEAALTREVERRRQSTVFAYAHPPPNLI